MRILDVSVPLSGRLPVYEGDPDTIVERWESMAAGALADVTRLQIGTHTGTHVDAPSHFLAGARTVDDLDLSACIGAVEVVDLTSLGDRLIGVADLAGRMSDDCERLLIKTQNSRLWSESRPAKSFAALSEPAAAYLVAQKLRLVGIDYLSIAPASDPGPVHRALLAAGAVILEGLDLHTVAAGRYTLACLPLRVAGAEGAPARAVLLPQGALSAGGQ